MNLSATEVSKLCLQMHLQRGQCLTAAADNLFGMLEVLVVRQSMTMPQNILLELNLAFACCETLIALYQV